MINTYAKLIKLTNSKGYTFTKVIRGPLNDNDKHWGMRSNLDFMKILKVDNDG